MFATLLARYLPNANQKERRFAVLLIGFGLLSFLIAFSHPHAIVFDEVYFAKFAQAFAQGQVAYDTHPPLGKGLIAIGIWLFGFTSFGYRLIVALFACGTLLLLPPTLNRLFQKPRMALLGTSLFLLQGLFLVYARLALLETFILFFAVLSLYFLLVAKQTDDLLTERNALFGAGLAAGLTVAIKWIGLGIMPTLWLWWWLLPGPAKATDTKSKFWRFFCLVLLPILVYVPTFFLITSPGHFWADFLTWHKEAWLYHADLTATHPYGSKWWSWPLELRPIWFYFAQSTTKLFGPTVQGIIAFGNPIVWWSSTLAILLSLGTVILSKAKDLRQKVSDSLLVCLLFSWAAFYLPWIKITRVAFLYHYFMPSFFSLLLLTYWLDRGLESRKFRDFSQLILSLSVLFYIYWLPLWTAIPVPQWFYQAHMWFRSWI